MKCVILTTDTKHHRYFANRLARHATTIVVLERRKLDMWKLYAKWVASQRTLLSVVDNPYLPLPYRRFHRLQDRFEDCFFSSGVPPRFSGHATLHEFFSVNDPACVELVAGLKPDMIVSFGTGLIKDGLLGIKALNVNIHRGILPKYRGLDSDLWAFYFNDFDNVGTTVHKLERTFDTGDILKQARLMIGAGMKVHHIRYHTTVLAADMVEELIGEVDAGRAVSGIAQNARDGGYYSFVPPLKRWRAIRNFNAHVASRIGHAHSMAESAKT